MRSFLVPFLLAASVVSVSLPEPAGCGTNSECLKRGLPLRKPARRWQAKRGGTIATTSVTGTFGLVYETSTLTESSTLTNGIYQIIDSGSGLQVTVTYPEGATTPQSGLNIQIVDPATNGQYLALSPTNSDDGSDVSSTTGDSLVLIGASATTLPGALPDNTIASTLGSSAYLETAVWTFDPSSNALSASWTRSVGTYGNETVPLTFMFTEGPSPYLTGSQSAFNMATPGYIAVTGVITPPAPQCLIDGASCQMDSDCCSAWCIAAGSPEPTCQAQGG